MKEHQWEQLHNHYLDINTENLCYFIQITVSFEEIGHLQNDNT